MTLHAYRVWLTYRGAWGFLGTLTWTTAAVYFLRDLGMSPLQLVLAGTALEIAYFSFEVPTGVVADLYSRKASMVVAAGLSGVAMLGIGVATSPGWAIAAMALWGCAWTFRSGAEDAWLADEVGAAAVGPAYQRSAQVARVTGLLGIGAAVGLALVDLRLPFLVAGGTALALAGYLVVAMPERGFVRPERMSGAQRVTPALATAREGTRLIRTTPVLVLIVLIFVLLGAWEEGFDRLWEAHLLLEVGLPELGVLGEVGWFGLFGATTLVLSFLVAAPLVRRIEHLDGGALARVLLGMHAVLMLCALGFALAGSVLVAAVAYLATAVVRDLTGPPVHTWLNGTITDSSVRATVLSLTGMAGSVGEWAGGPALGAVGTRWSVRVALAAGALLLAPTLVLFGRAVRHGGEEPELTDATEPVQ